MKKLGMALLLTVAAATALAPMVASGSVADRASQREWMRANGKDPGVWALRLTGNAKDGYPRSLTHGTRTDKNDSLSSALPGADCQSSCHIGQGNPPKTSKTIWDDIAEYEDAKLADSSFLGYEGFTNVFGETARYRGRVFYPADLLNDPANDTKHAEMFKAEGGGCGVCHSPKAAFDRGAVTTVNGTELADLKGCKDCHEFSLSAPGNGHTTHATLITAEIPLADASQAPGTTACVYCHGDLEGSQGNASCWNCHLSGHWPKVSYWKATPSIPAP